MMEGVVEGGGGEDRHSLTMTTRAGSGSSALAGFAGAGSFGDAETTSPVHGSYGMVEMITEADDLLSSHLDFMHRYEYTEYILIVGTRYI